MAALSWHCQSFAKASCHFCAVSVLCSCSVTLSVPPELRRESCCHPTPQHAGVCRPLLAGAPAALDEVPRSLICARLWHTQPREHTAVPVLSLCPWLSPVAGMLSLGRAAVRDHIPAWQ